MQGSQSQVPVRKSRFSRDNHHAKSILDSNGPIFMPNSRLMQQMLRFDFERYQEDIGDGKSLMDPTVICIPRGMNIYRLGVKCYWKLMALGTRIPPALVLWREGLSRFSLQPSHPLEIESESCNLSGKINRVVY